VNALPVAGWVALGLAAAVTTAFCAVCMRMQARGVRPLKPHPGRRCLPKEALVVRVLDRVFVLVQRIGIEVADAAPAAQEVSR
jgi:hypothetical protein